MTDGIHILHVPEKHRYEIRDGDQVAGLTQYRLPDDGHVDFIHTETSSDYEGQGMAARVVEFALDDVRAQNKRIIPHCPYVAGFIRKHPEYEDITDWPAG